MAEKRMFSMNVIDSDVLFGKLNDAPFVTLNDAVPV